MKLDTEVSISLFSIIHLSCGCRERTSHLMSEGVNYGRTADHVDMLLLSVYTFEGYVFQTILHTQGLGCGGMWWDVVKIGIG